MNYFLSVAVAVAVAAVAVAADAAVVAVVAAVVAAAVVVAAAAVEVDTEQLAADGVGNKREETIDVAVGAMPDDGVVVVVGPERLGAAGPVGHAPSVAGVDFYCGVD